VFAARNDRLRSVCKLSLHDEHSMLRALIDNMPDFMYVKDIHSVYRGECPRGARSGEDSPEKLLEEPTLTFFPRELADAYFQDEQKRYAIRPAPPRP